MLKIHWNLSHIYTKCIRWILDEVLITFRVYQHHYNCMGHNFNNNNNKKPHQQLNSFRWFFLSCFLSGSVYGARLIRNVDLMCVQLCGKFNESKSLVTHRCHYRWCEKNLNVSVRRTVPILLMNTCVRAADSVNCFSPKRLYDHSVEHPFVVHRSRAEYVQRCKPKYTCRLVLLLFFI